MSDAPSPQLYARVPVRWEDRYLVNEHGDRLGYVVPIGDQFLYVIYVHEAKPDHAPTQADARRAVEEYWNCTTENPHEQA